MVWPRTAITAEKNSPEDDLSFNSQRKTDSIRVDNLKTEDEIARIDGRLCEKSLGNSSHGKQVAV